MAFETEEVPADASESTCRTFGSEFLMTGLGDCRTLCCGKKLAPSATTHVFNDGNGSRMDHQ